MHELAIANSIVETVQQEVERQHLPPVEKIVVRLGALSDIVPEALLFNYEIITRDTSFAKTQLEIEVVPLEGKCGDCGQNFPVEDYIFSCPECNSGNIEVIRGEELDIAYIEVEDAEH